MADEKVGVAPGTLTVVMPTYATPARRQYTGGTVGSLNYITASWPSATQSGSLLLAFVSTSSWTVTITPPSG